MHSAMHINDLIDITLIGLFWNDAEIISITRQIYGLLTSHEFHNSKNILKRYNKVTMTKKRLFKSIEHFISQHWKFSDKKKLL